MDFRRMTWAAVLATAVVGAAAAGARAAEPSSPERTTDEPLATSPPPAERAPFGEKYYPASPLAQRRPLMSLLDRAGLSGPLDDARIRIFGHVEASYTYNPDDPAADLNLGRVFDAEANQATFNQLDLNFERTVNLSSSAWDIGGRVELLYGGDARFIHSNGMFDNQDFFDGPGKPVRHPASVRRREYSRRQWPARLCRQVPLLQADRSQRQRLLLPLLHLRRCPAVHADGHHGVLRVEQPVERRGRHLARLGQSLKDNNDMVDFLGRIRYSPSDRTSFAVLFITGPEQDDDNGAIPRPPSTSSAHIAWATSSR